MERVFKNQIRREQAHEIIDMDEDELLDLILEGADDKELAKQLGRNKQIAKDIITDLEKKNIY
ncbi:MAG TPA: hypothetical protein GXZ32_01770 [Clostridiales bacterium]|nr:hypothetical protein [Clostridiales bacterium]